jgi:spore germination protein GerM
VYNVETGVSNMNPRVVLFLVALAGTGIWLRTLPLGSGTPRMAGWWPFARSADVTLYFTDGPFLFPVTRRLPASADVPGAALEALFEGPRAGSGLTSPVPLGLEVRSLAVEGGVARIDLSADLVEGTWDRVGVETAILETMTSLPGVTSVELSVGGHPSEGPRTRTPLLYYASAEGLKAVPNPAMSAEAAVAAYMAGPPDATLVGLPRDVRLAGYAYDNADGVVSLDFTYTDSTRTLAIEKPDIMRSVLLGLVASLTELPGVQAVEIDFGGQSRLGLGECSDLLRTRQPRPRLLNDERLLGR